MMENYSTLDTSETPPVEEPHREGRQEPAEAADVVFELVDYGFDVQIGGVDADGGAGSE